MMRKAKPDDYRYWFEALKRSPVKDWSPDVAEAFGAGAYAKTFEQWWPLVRRRFEQMEHLYFDVIESYEELEGDDRFKDPDSLILVVNMLEPAVDLIAQFEKLMRERHPGRRGKPKHDDFSLDWTLKRVPNNAFCERAFKVYDSYMKGLQPHWKIAVAHNIGHHPKDGEPAPSLRPALTSAITRYLKHAAAMIRGAREGWFPASPEDFDDLVIPERPK